MCGSKPRNKGTKLTSFVGFVPIAGPAALMHHCTEKLADAVALCALAEAVTFTR